MVPKNHYHVLRKEFGAMKIDSKDYNNTNDIK